MDLNNECKLKGVYASILTTLHHQVSLKAEPKTLTTSQSQATKFSSAARTFDRFGISNRSGAAIVSIALQDGGIISENNASNVVERNKIRRERTKARTTLSSQSVIKDYDHDQFGLYFDGRKERNLSMEENRRKVIIEEYVSLVKEPGSEYIGHVSVNFGREQIIGNHIYSFLPCVDNYMDVTKLVATEHLSTQVSKEVIYVTWN
ncbi:hypothetical protein AVEN_92729-1 [Araneus ventricosus]|uniref:Uncharacterized protein n=1 Tax=Araneus ventricosus TaxID=182803 RepID=A0A4Y2IFD4_ARAVE|nr:hypothetical protein AVEN_92729-1 [Araneus ventricosus]